MPEINKQTVSPLAKTAKLNEVIEVLNAMAYNMTVRAGVGNETPQLKLAENNAELIVSAGGSDLLTFDVVVGNQARQYQWRASEVT